MESKEQQAWETARHLNAMTGLGVSMLMPQDDKLTVCLGESPMVAIEFIWDRRRTCWRSPAAVLVNPQRYEALAEQAAALASQEG
jgi:hypothetical protein